MEGWSDFFLAEVGAAAAIAGLFVVAISINISRILDYPALPGRAANTLIIIGAALTISSLGLLPAQPLWAFGLETLAVDLVILVSGMRGLGTIRKHRKADDPVSWLVIAIAFLVQSTLPYFAGGVLLVAGQPAGLYCIAIGVIVSFAITLENGWVLLIEILR
jgi:hypothetical protein